MAARPLPEARHRGADRTLLDVLELHGTHLADRIALIDEHDRTCTYAGLRTAMRSVAGSLRAVGIGPSDVVAIASEATIDGVVALCGAMLAGAIAAPVNTRLGPLDLGEFVSSLEPTIVLTDEAPAGLRGSVPVAPLRPHAEVGFAAPSPVGASLAIAFPTGGTTGTPKAAVRSHDAITRLVVSNALHLSVGRSERELFLSPLFHLTVVSGLLSTLLMGGTVYLLSRFDAERAAAAFVGFRPTRMLATPAVMTRLLDLLPGGRPNRCPITITYGAARSAPGFVERVLNDLPGARLITGYGATEFGAVTRLYSDDPEWGAPEAVGRPVAGVSIRVSDESGRDVGVGDIGEFVVSSPFAMERYIGRDEDPFTADGAIRSGDLGRVDDAGCFHLVGRSKEMIKSGGENVYSGEVERVLMLHPDIVEAAVYGVADDVWGERVEAVVVARSDGSASEETLRRHCAAQLAGFKVPKRIAFVPVLPYTSTMKVDRRQLPAWAARMRAR